MVNFSVLERMNKFIYHWKFSESDYLNFIHFSAAASVTHDILQCMEVFLCYATLNQKRRQMASYRSPGIYAVTIHLCMLCCLTVCVVNNNLTVSALIKSVGASFL
jgi:hypothetical protein